MCYMYTVMAYFNPALTFQREQKHACCLWRAFRAMLIAKHRKFRIDLLKNREVSEKS